MIITTRVVVGFALLFCAAPAAAETVEVAKDVRVTKKTYANVPINEQPFFGFANKTPELRTLDDAFIDDVVKAAGSREKAFEATSQRAWTLIAKGNFKEAAKRFNQAWLLSPEQSSVYHGFGIIAIARFNDADFADELFKRARTQPSPLKALNADYGRFLLIAKRPKEAQAQLEQAVVETPDLPDAWSNLGFARFQNGDGDGACAAAARAGKLKVSFNVDQEINTLRRQAQCK